MCHTSVLSFGTQYLSLDVIEGKSILEVGSYIVNESLRTQLMYLRPASYLGIDINPGPGVDQVCDARNLVDTFGEDAFDVVISTECLEHIEDWRSAVSNMKRVCREHLFVTTRSAGFPLHEYPADYWRFSVDDFVKIFSDFPEMVVASDEQVPGVFIFAKKPDNFIETDLSDIHPTTPGE